MKPEELRPHLDRVLLGWTTCFRGPASALPAFALSAAGPELLLEIAAEEGPRPVRGRLSAFALLCGRFWAAAEQDAESYRLRGAWVPTLLERPTEGCGLHAVLAEDGVADALRAAGALFRAAGEREEAALCVARASPREGEARLSEAVAGFKRADAVERLQAARAAEAAIHRLPDAEALEAFAGFRPSLRVLVADVQPAVVERGLALAEAWARRLFARRAYAEVHGLLDMLLEANVLVLASLRMRLEARLAAGDVAGARNDHVRLARVRARAGDLLAAGSALATADPDEWYVSALLRVSRAHRAWARGQDPCPDRKAPARRPSAGTRQHHLTAARARLREAAALAERVPEGEVRARLREELERDGAPDVPRRH